MSLSIYPKHSQALAQVFAEEPCMKSILIVPIDTAKRIHVARICDGAGNYVSKNPINIANTTAGIDFLRTSISQVCDKRNVKKSHVIVALEDPAAYACNFFYRLEEDGYLVVRVNAREASIRRKNSRTSSDVTDLDGICRMVIDRKAYDLRIESGIFGEMRMVAKERRRLVSSETAMKNCIHRSLELLFPGFSDLSQVDVFGRPALKLMADNFHSARFATMNQTSLAKKLKSYGDPLPDQSALSIIASAQLAPKHMGHHDQLSQVLAAHVQMLETIRVAVAQQTTAMGKLLAQTDGVYFTTIPGIAVALAGHTVAELGVRGLYGYASKSASYSGIIPLTEQSGGPGAPTRSGHLPSSCNRVLKDYIMQAAKHVGTTNLPGRQADGCDNRHDLLDYYANKELRGGRSRLATARKLLRLMSALATHRQVYQPPQWFDRHKDIPDHACCFLDGMLEALKRKWMLVGINPMEDPNELGKMTREFAKLAEEYRAGTVTTLEG